MIKFDLPKFTDGEPFRFCNKLILTLSAVCMLKLRQHLNFLNIYCVKTSRDFNDSLSISILGYNWLCLTMPF